MIFIFYVKQNIAERGIDITEKANLGCIYNCGVTHFAIQCHSATVFKVIESVFP